jgi:hypothetical protein
VSNIRTGAIRTVGGGGSEVAELVAGVSQIAGSIVVPSIVALDGGAPAIVATARSFLYSRDRPSYASIIDVEEPIVAVPPPLGAGTRQLYMIGTPQTLRPGEEVYIGPGGMRAARAEAEGALASGTLLELHMHSSAEPGAGVVTYTVFQDGAPTSCAFTITGAVKTGVSKFPVDWPEGGLFAVRVQNAGAAEAYHRGSIVFAPTEPEEPGP